MPSMNCSLEQILTHSAGTKMLLKLSYLTICFSSLDGPKPHSRKLDQSSRNRHSPQTSVRELILHPQRHQLHNGSRGRVRTRIILTCSITRGLFQRHHLARAALGHRHSTVQAVLTKSSRGDGRGGDLWVGWTVYNVVAFLSDERLFVCLHSLINRMLSFSFPLIFFLSFILIVAGRDLNNPNASESSHTNNWAVLVCASRYWFNYRVRIVGPLDVSCT
jgi:hypothetical protein